MLSLIRERRYEASCRSEVDEKSRAQSLKNCAEAGRGVEVVRDCILDKLAAELTCYKIFMPFECALKGRGLVGGSGEVGVVGW
jgi:hypothetical protein